MLARRITRGAVSGLALILVAAFTALSLISLLPGSSRSAGTKWVTKRVGWDASAANGAGITLSSGGKDTILIVGATNPVDSNRTVSISTGDWAWEEVLRSAYNSQSAGVASSGDSLLSIALLTVTCQTRTAGNRTDTLYAVPEQCFNGTCGHSDIAHSGTTIAQCFPLVADPQSKWGGAVSGTTPYTLTSAPGAVFQGYIRVDPNSAVGGGQGLTMKPNFRFNIIPGGTSNAITLYGCRAYITYPQRAQP
jgi:hypothetical protein